MDVFIVDKKTRQRVKRLWLTVLIDAYSRCVLGFALLYEHPCIESIFQALEKSIWPKPNLPDYGITQRWPCYGIPIQLFLDNAWAHHSLSLESAANEIGYNGQYNSIDLVFRPPYMGRYGALIERFFGTLSLRIRNQLRDRGAIQSDHPHDIRNAAKAACLLYEDIYKFVLEEIVRYQNTPHSSLNKMTPNEKWDEAMETNLPIVPPQTAPFLRILMRTHNSSVRRTRKGLPFMGMYYSSQRMRQHPKYDPKTHEEHRYTLRFNPLDISNVAVYCKGKFIDMVHPAKLRLPDGSYREVSVAEREIARYLAQAAGRKHPGQDWVDYIEELGQTVKERIEEKRETRKTHKRNKQKQEEQKASRSGSRSTDAQVPSGYSPVGSNEEYVIVGGSNSDQQLAVWTHKE